MIDDRELEEKKKNVGNSGIKFAFETFLYAVNYLDLEVVNDSFEKLIILWCGVTRETTEGQEALCKFAKVHLESFHLEAPRCLWNYSSWPRVNCQLHKTISPPPLRWP